MVTDMLDEKSHLLSNAGEARSYPVWVSAPERSSLLLAGTTALQLQQDGISGPSRPAVRQRSRQEQTGCTQSMLALDSLNLWIADVQGLGALAAIFLSSHEKGGLGWSLSQTGFVMTAMGLSNVAASPFAGHVMDSTHRKREIMAFMLSLTGLTYGVLWRFTESSVFVAAALIVQSVVGAAYGPGVNSLSTGLVGISAFPARCARNEIAKHIGGIISAVLPILIIHRWGYHLYFVAIGAMTVMACFSALAIRAEDIDHLSACGSALVEQEKSGAPPLQPRPFTPGLQWNCRGTRTI